MIRCIFSIAKTDSCNTRTWGSKLGFNRFIHSSSQNEFEAGKNNIFEGNGETNNLSQRDNRINSFFPRENRSNNFPERLNNFPERLNNFPERLNSFPERLNNFPVQDNRINLMERGNGRNNKSMNFVRNIMQPGGNDRMGFYQQGNYNIENNADIVHMKLMKNNTFITVTDSKGNKKIGASSGCLSEMKGGPKLSRYAAEATAEHIGRVAKNMGIKSVVVKVNGFTYFKKKRQAILSFRDGYTNSRSDQNPVVYIEDTTRKPHNGCRLRKKRRV